MTKRIKSVFLLALLLALSLASAPTAPAAGDDSYIGSISVTAATYPPQNWAFCNGQLISISENMNLFSIIGITYGGNGTTNFALPDLRGRMPIGMGRGSGLTRRNLGGVGGLEYIGSGVTGSGVNIFYEKDAAQMLYNMPPFHVFNFIICINGQYPIRQ